MDKDGVIKLSGHKKIKLKIDENTYIEMSTGKISLHAENIECEGTNITITGSTKTEIKKGKDSKILVEDNITLSGAPDIIIN